MSTMRVALSAMGAGTKAIVAGLPTDPVVADELASLRVLPGEEIEVVQILPFGGPLLIRGAGGLYAVGRRLADQVKVKV